MLRKILARPDLPDAIEDIRLSIVVPVCADTEIYLFRVLVCLEGFGDPCTISEESFRGRVGRKPSEQTEDWVGRTGRNIGPG
jgi:hypothetical protein